MKVVASQHFLDPWLASQVFSTASIKLPHSWRVEMQLKEAAAVDLALVALTPVRQLTPSSEHTLAVAASLEAVTSQVAIKRPDHLT